MASQRFAHPGRLGIILSLTLVLIYGTIAAQNNFTNPFYSGVPYNEIWSVNSQQFVFYDLNGGILEAGVEIPDTLWLRYDVTSGQVTRNNVWQLQPSLTNTEHQLFNVGVNPDGQTSFIFISPDSRFLVYGRGNTTDDFGRWSLGLADRQQGQSITLPVQISDPYSGPIFFKVFWSADSKAFTVSFLTDDASPVFAHVSGYNTNLSSALVTWSDFLSGNRRFYPVVADEEKIFDLSGDGSKVLLTIREEVATAPTPYDHPTKLVIWNPLNPNTSQIIDNLDGRKISAASFAPTDETKLLIVNDTGVLIYNLSNSQSTILTNNISTSTTRETIFSPDGKWLIIMTNSAASIANTSSLINPSPTPSPASNTIVFQTNRDGNDEIYVMNNDGSSPLRRTNNTFSDIIPDWSPDRSKIAFSSNRDGNYELYWMNADGTGQTRLTTATGSDGNPSWSPDGTKIVFVSQRDGNREIYVRNADGTQTRLTNNAAEEDQPDWSPDGTKIVFTSTRDGNGEIYTMNTNGTGVTRLTNNTATDGVPAWSPDGTKIAFASNRDGDYEVWLMNADGSSPVQVTTNTASDGFHVVSPTVLYGGIAWSADGTQLVFISNRDGNIELYRLNANATQTRLTTNTFVDTAPDG